ncbi:hypothetical protein WA026_017697 [Henosepilachna vigintioctopunctata]|uniref:Uncharacterized protein n=1 Tax=Henosepilachna vigintioctopunctata TaxID=420089 RepID=A0AAW1U8U2_9CUCU
MPNPLKKFFRRPSVKRVKKVASRHFRKFFPERGYYDVGKNRERGGGVPDWLSKQMKLEDAAWQHGLQPRPYKGRRHTLDEPRSGGRVRPYHTIEGFVPCGGGMVSGFSQSISMGDLSELAANDSRDQTQYAYCSIPPDTSQQSAACHQVFSSLNHKEYQHQKLVRLRITEELYAETK